MDGSGVPLGRHRLFDDANLSFVWNFDKFRPPTWGRQGSPTRYWMRDLCFAVCPIAGKTVVLYPTFRYRPEVALPAWVRWISGRA